MKKGRRRFGYLVFGFLQAGVSSAVAAAIACRHDLGTAGFWPHWTTSWILPWLTTIPVVALATPVPCRALERFIVADN